MVHMPGILRRTFQHYLLARDARRLRRADVPVETLSATFTEDLKKELGLPDNNTIPDVVLSRAHYSMARGFVEFIQTSDKRNHAQTLITAHLQSWLVDPLNHLYGAEKRQLMVTAAIGKQVARHSWLALIKSLADRYGRKKMPLKEVIVPPLQHLVARVTQPVVSFHIVTGNMLVESGHAVVQVITDPHVRSEYVTHAGSPLLTLCVFDERTRADVFEQAGLLGKALLPHQVVVTGPPIDQRIIDLGKRKAVYDNTRALRICMATGGLGTNQTELLTALRVLLPYLKARRDRQSTPPFEVTMFLGTNQDLARRCAALARAFGVRYTHGGRALGHKSTHTLHIIVHPQITDANEQLIQHIFPWADVCVTKPSGDMAYDAAAAGCAILSLAEWGPWEHRVREVFEQAGISRKALPEAIDIQLLGLLTKGSGKAREETSWIVAAQQRAHHLREHDPFFAQGCEQILQTHQRVAAQAQRPR